MRVGEKLLDYKKILVPYDGSACSNRAVDIALEFAKSVEGSQVILLHVLPEVPFIPLYMGTVRSKKTGEAIPMAAHLKEIHQEMKNKMLRELEMKAKLYAHTDIPIKTKVLMGSPSVKIIEFAKEEAVDLIVMGRLGVTGVRKFIKALGSVSRAVAEMSPCPIMRVNK